MEPANLTPPPDDEARLAAFVRENLPPLPDDGFSGRVLAALPAPRRCRSCAIELALIVAGTAAGVAFALGQGVTISGALGGLARLRDASDAVAARIDGSSLAFAALLALGTVVLGLAVARLRWSRP